MDHLEQTDIGEVDNYEQDIQINDSVSAANRYVWLCILHRANATIILYMSLVLSKKVLDFIHDTTFSIVNMLCGSTPPAIFIRSKANPQKLHRIDFTNDEKTVKLSKKNYVFISYVYNIDFV